MTHYTQNDMIRALCLWEYALKTDNPDFKLFLNNQGYAEARSYIICLAKIMRDADKYIESILQDQSWPLPYDWEYTPLYFNMVRWHETGYDAPMPHDVLHAWQKHCNEADSISRSKINKVLNTLSTNPIK